MLFPLLMLPNSLFTELRIVGRYSQLFKII